MTESKVVGRKLFPARPYVLNSTKRIISQRLSKLVTPIVRFLINKFDLPFYHPDELQGWGHCGCCGMKMYNTAFPKYWAWGLCESCQENHPVKEDEK